MADLPLRLQPVLRGEDLPAAIFVVDHGNVIKQFEGQHLLDALEGTGTDAAGKLLASLERFSYDPATRVLTLDVSDLATKDEVVAALQAKQDTLPAATDDVADKGTDGTFRKWSAALIRRVVEAIVPAWARAADPHGGSVLPEIPGGGEDYSLHGRNPDGFPSIRFWTRPNYVPDTPGTQSGIGRVLTVIGEDDQDYAFRDLPAGHGGEGEGGGVDQVARTAAAAAQDAADAAGRTATGADQKAQVNSESIGQLGKAVEALSAAGLLIREDPAKPVAATAQNADKILYRAGWLYEAEPLHYAAKAVTYRDFAVGDLPPGYTWGGAIQVNPHPDTVPDNRVIYSIPAERWERKITGGGHAWWVGYDLANWQGARRDKAEADGVVGKVGDVVFFGGKVQVVETYVDRAPDGWQWVPLEDPAVAAAKAELENDLDNAMSGSSHAQIGDASLTLIQFGDGRGVWTKEGFLALSTVEPSTAYDPARAGGYGAGATASFEGVNYTALPGGEDPPGAFDPTKWTRDAEQPTPYDQYSILARLRNPDGLPDGQWVLTTRHHPDEASEGIQWLDGAPAITNRLDLYQKDPDGLWVEAGDNLTEGLLLFRFTIGREDARGLFRNADNTREVIRDNLHFLLGKALNIGNYNGLGIDVRITVQSQPVDPTTPRRLPHIPQPMLEGELIRLTEDDVPHPTSEQVYRFGPNSSDFNPSYGNVFPDAPTVAEGGRVNVFGVALAGTFGGVLDQFGPDNQYKAFGEYVPGVLRANGVRAIYTRSDHPSRLYIRMARALVADGEVDALKLRLGSFDTRSNTAFWPYHTADLVPVPAETTPDFRTFYAEIVVISPDVERNIYQTFNQSSPDPDGGFVFSILKGAAAWLHFNAVTNAVGFEEGQRFKKGFYEGAGDGNPVRVYLPRAVPTKRFERAVGTSGEAGNVPEGTHTIEALVKTVKKAGEDRTHSRRIRLGALTAAAQVWPVESGNASDPSPQRDISLSMAYAVETRTLTYARTQSIGVASIELWAIGEA